MTAPPADKKSRREFAQYVTGTHPDQTIYRKYVFDELRLAIQRMRIYIHNVEEIGIFLQQGAIEPDRAIQELHKINMLGFLIPTTPLAAPVEHHDKPLDPPDQTVPSTESAAETSQVP